MTQLNSGQTLASRFTLIRRLGRGGMGDVWLIRDEQLGSELVAKIVPANATAEEISLLRQECRNSRRLAHPNIVRVYDFHQDSAASFITMEYVEGGDLCELRGAPPGQIIQTVLPLVDALEHAHAEGVIHRDIKCANVLIDGSGRARLSDFGIAGLAAPGPDDLQVAGGGSGHHASPQQQAGQAPSVADDIYGLGIMLSDLLGPHRPLAAGLEELISNMTAKEVEDRTRDLSSVRAILQEYAELEGSATMPPRIARQEIRLSPPPRVPAVRQAESPGPRLARQPGEESPARHPYWWMTITAFVVLAVAVVAVFALLPKWVEQQQPGVGETQLEVTASESGPVRTLEPIESSSGSPAASSETPDLPSPEPLSSSPEPTTSSAAEGEIAARQEPELRVPVDEGEQVRQPSVTPTPPARRGPDPTAEAFAEAMSRGLAAFDSGDFEVAQKAFEEALLLVPGSAEAADGVARSERALSLAAIRRHREKAEAFEKEDRWREAEAEYKAALALDSSLRFAREGESRASDRARLAEQMSYHIDHPQRMVDDQVLEEARQVLAEADALDSLTPGLQKQRLTLQQVVEVASTPVQVVLQSDNSTEVVVYRVGRLGRFDRRELELRPGTYTVVGTRDGYRDVRRQLRVEAGGQSQPLTVRCEEKI